MLPPPPEPAPRPSGLPRFALGLVIALCATGAYICFLIPELAYKAAIPAHAGCVLFLLLLWAVPFGGSSPNWQRRGTLALVAFGLVMAGYINLLRYEGSLRSELNALRYQRLALPDGERLRDRNEDPFGQELEKGFGEKFLEPGTFKPNWKSRTAAAKIVEDRRPGWPRALDQFRRYLIVEFPRGDGDEYNYGREPRLACGHYYSRGLGLSACRPYEDALRAEKRLMARAELDREIFLAGWKKLPPEERGEEIGK